MRYDNVAIIETTLENGRIVMRSCIGDNKRIVGQWRYTGERLRSIPRRSPSRFHRFLVWLFESPESA